MTADFITVIRTGGKGQIPVARDCFQRTLSQLTSMWRLWLKLCQVSRSIGLAC